MVVGYLVIGVQENVSSTGKKFAMLARFATRVFPGVEKELKAWQRAVQNAEDPLLREQGLASIKKKKFHCLGGSIYSMMGGAHQDTLQLIVAFQTISDYLDNLCDRADCLEMDAFRQLHKAFTDALIPRDSQVEASCQDYYSLYPHREDGGYLQSLVEECQDILCYLPAYAQVQECALATASLYCDLQTYKHTHLHLRENCLVEWFAKEGHQATELDYWWEFAAAAGSTLGIFALMAAAGQKDLDQATALRITEGYFPWISGLHILLDYFIDQEEDRLEGDLNFVSYYESPEEAVQRLGYFLQEALHRAALMPDPQFHTTVVQGLPAFYLSDPKVEKQGLEEDSLQIIEAAGEETMRMYRVCRNLRNRGKI